MNVDWLINTSVVRQKVDLRRTFHFDTRIYPVVRGFINIFSICACSRVRFGTVEVENWLKSIVYPYYIRSMEIAIMNWYECWISLLFSTKDPCYFHSKNFENISSELRIFHCIFLCFSSWKAQKYIANAAQHLSNILGSETLAISSILW